VDFDYRIKKTVLDTGPLLSAITLEFIRTLPSARRESILSKSGLELYLINSHVKQENFLLFFQSIDTVLTTSHVIAELHGLRFLKGQAQIDFWCCAITLLKKKVLSEELVRLLELDSNGLCRKIGEIGPTDIALTELARSQGCILLTEDRRTLAPWAWSQGVDCRVVQEII
jgi:hypothetical protein